MKVWLVDSLEMSIPPRIQELPEDLITVCHSPDSQFVGREGNKRVIVGIEPELPDWLPVTPREGTRPTR